MNNMNQSGRQQGGKVDHDRQQQRYGGSDRNRQQKQGGGDRDRQQGDMDSQQGGGQQR